MQLPYELVEFSGDRPMDLININSPQFRTDWEGPPPFAENEKPSYYTRIRSLRLDLIDNDETRLFIVSAVIFFASPFQPDDGTLKRVTFPLSEILDLILDIQYKLREVNWENDVDINVVKRLVDEYVNHHEFLVSRIRRNKASAYDREVFDYLNKRIGLYYMLKRKIEARDYNLRDLERDEKYLKNSLYSELNISAYKPNLHIRELEEDYREVIQKIKDYNWIRYKQNPLIA